MATLATLSQGDMIARERTGIEEFLVPFFLVNNDCGNADREREQGDKEASAPAKVETLIVIEIALVLSGNLFLAASGFCHMRS